MAIHEASTEQSRRESIDFVINEPDEARRRSIEIGLHRLGCRTYSNRDLLHVWLPDHAAINMLSGREVQLVSLASKGNTDKEIANLVGLSIYTVRSYWVRICHKLGANNRTHAVSLVLGHDPIPD